MKYSSVIDEKIIQIFTFRRGDLNTTPKKRQKNFCQMTKSKYDTGFGRMVETHLIK